LKYYKKEDEATFREELYKINKLRMLSERMQQDIIKEIAYETSSSALYEALLGNISYFNSGNTEVFSNEEVNEVSCLIKEQTKNDCIYIETNTAIWFELEKEVLLEK